MEKEIKAVLNSSEVAKIRDVIDIITNFCDMLPTSACQGSCPFTCNGIPNTCIAARLSNIITEEKGVLSYKGKGVPSYEKNVTEM